MKDALGHGSNPRGSHSAGIDALPKPQTVVGYHGTARQFDQLQPNTPETPGGKDVHGIFFSGDQRAAGNFAMQDRRRVGGAGKMRVISANLTMSNPLDITNAIKNGQRRGLSFGDAKRAALTKLTPMHDGVIFKGNGQNPPEYVVFHPSQVSEIKK